MRPGGFVEAVRKAVALNSDDWDLYYYEGALKKCGQYEWDDRKRPVYMETRASAIGPEWRALQYCVLQMKGLVSRVGFARPIGRR